MNNRKNNYRSTALTEVVEVYLGIVMNSMYLNSQSIQIRSIVAYGNCGFATLFVCILYQRNREVLKHLPGYLLLTIES